MSQPEGTIRKDAYWDAIALVNRVQWLVELSNGTRKITRTRREAIEWCDEMGVPYQVR